MGFSASDYQRQKIRINRHDDEIAQVKSSIDRLDARLRRIEKGTVGFGKNPGKLVLEQRKPHIWTIFLLRIRKLWYHFLALIPSEVPLHRKAGGFTGNGTSASYCSGVKIKDLFY
jgi:hypothetical protein